MTIPEREPVPDDERLNQLVRDAFGGEIPPFKPFAILHPDLDWIIVLVRDCSYTESWVDGTLYLLVDNYPEQEQETCVGFHIYFASMFCRRFDLATDGGDVDLNDVLDALQFVAGNDPTKTAEARRCLDHLSSTIVNIG